MNSFALFRLPYEQVVTRVVQHDRQPVAGQVFSDVYRQKGFVFAPFAVSDDCPLLLIRADEVCKCPLDELTEELLRSELGSPFLCESSWRKTGVTDERSAYHEAFRLFHGALSDGTFNKLVLSRCSHVSGSTVSPFHLFLRACRDYPRMFVAMVSTPLSGTWLMASPELLIEGKDDVWHTMALAGTMRLENEQLAFDNPSREGVQNIRWSQKNIQEQRYVASYIMHQLSAHTREIEEQGPFTKRAADLVHLCSDFRFSFKGDSDVDEVVQSLHPTPAVCGLPKRTARDFILLHEPWRRRYYSGYCGPLALDSSTHLFVSLRCMEICQEGYDLYAGGGLLRDSIEQQEWDETEAKLQTMRRIIR